MKEVIQMKTYYYIDSENVNADVYCSKMHKLPSTATVLLFYTNKSKPMPVQFMERIQESVCSIDSIKCVNGTPNSLDFVLVTKLGEMCYRCPRSKHVIISKDKGYTAAIEYWKSKGVVVYQENSIKIIDELEDKEKVCCST